jgi:hypothetical protein
MQQKPTVKSSRPAQSPAGNKALPLCEKNNATDFTALTGFCNLFINGIRGVWNLLS